MSEFVCVVRYGFENISNFDSVASLDSPAHESLFATKIVLGKYTKTSSYTFYFIRKQFISNLVLDPLKFKKPLALHGKS